MSQSREFFRYLYYLLNQVKNVFTWLIENSTPEWVQLYASDIVNTFKNNGKLSELAMSVMNDPIIIKYFKGFEEILNK